MAKINILTPEVYNYIAAGEVVERPASVVKELVENSIDAKSSIIEIEIKNGGTEEIRVTDNGVGIDKADVKNAFLPHATSKIALASDLDNILTLGFRGEALASIAAVSKVEMITKTKDSLVATDLKIEGGKVINEQETGSKDGTTTFVRDLFYCTPARQKFLRKPKQEEQEVTNLVARFILSHPEISFTYIADGKCVYSSNGKTKKEAMFAIYGKSSIDETLEVNLEMGDLKLTGYVGRPSYCKPNRTYQTLIINGRYVINQTVSTAVNNAYGDMLMKRKYPFYVLYLTMPTASVDVNVHPNKLDVRFENSQKIYMLFFEGVSRALTTMDYVSSVDMPEDNKLKEQFSAISNFSDVVMSQETSKPSKIDKAGVNLNPFSFDASSMSDMEKRETTAAVIETLKNVDSGNSVKDGFGLGSKLLERLAKTGEKENFASSSYSTHESASQLSLGIEASIKKVGKAFNTYLIIEVDDDIFFIDQHAAHERILYEKFKRQYDTNSIVVQPLLFPYVLTLNSIEATILYDNLDIIRSLGFEIEDFGSSTFKISAVPAIVSEINFDQFFSGFLSDSKSTVKKSSDLIREQLMQHSCKSAIKGGNDLTDSEINQLYSQMGKEKIALFCPHGRPIAIRINKQEIEKWFKRIV